ncbi:hypothetical protein B566_EDAN007572 [Ephemera danica]|nr:hypothetical protein B566_EDAN007572 [Ephemera danica]
MGESQEPLLSADAASYEILAELGHCTGTFGHVVLVRHVPTNTLLAAKQYEIDKLSADESSLVQHEVTLVRQLCHPNVLPCLTSFVWGQTVCILSPLMDLGSCHDLVVNHFQEGLPELAIAFILRDALQGLEYIHRQGLVLRSIRASHLLVSGRGRVRISGLRYACSMVQNGRWQHTLHDFPPSSLPNLNWLSPELLEQNLLGYSEKSDIYSVGITTCEMANGVVPYADMPAMLMLTEKLGDRTPQLLDCYAFPVIDNHPNGCQADSGVGGSVESSGAEAGGLNAVERRKFSEYFHLFVELCLRRQPEQRPSPSRLLSHSFFKQCRRGPQLSLAAVISPAINYRASAASSQDDVLELTAGYLSDLQMEKIEWTF